MLLVILKVNNLFKIFTKWKGFGGSVEVELDLPNYATKTDLKNVTDVDTSDLALRTVLLKD